MKQLHYQFTFTPSSTSSSSSITHTAPPTEQPLSSSSLLTNSTTTHLLSEHITFTPSSTSSSSSSSSAITHHAISTELPPSSSSLTNATPHLPSEHTTPHLLSEHTTPTTNDSSTKKRRRLDTEEKRILTEIFFENPKPNAEARLQLAQRLDMTPRGIQIWFQNQRSKLRRDEKTLPTADEEKEEDSASTSSPEGTLSDGNLTRDGGESALLPGPSEDEASRSTQANFITPPPATMTEEPRDQPTVNEPPSPDRTNVQPPRDNVNDGNQPKPHQKQRRRRLNPEETDALLNFFEQTEKPNAALRNELSARLNLPAHLIGIWFQNQRAKRKRLTALPRPVNHTPTEVRFSYSNVPLTVGHENGVHREVEGNTNVDSTCAQQVATSSLYTHDALNPQAKSPSDDNSAVAPYADQTKIPCQSASWSNSGVAATEIPQKTHDVNSSNTTRRRSRASPAFEEEGRHLQQRRRMTKEELCILSAVFARTRMPTIETREELATQFDRTPRSIQIWFQNQRSKLKRGLVTLESYRRIGEGLMRRDINNSMDALGESDGNEVNGEWED